MKSEDPNREASAAMLWVIIIIIFLVVGLAIYNLAGASHFQFMERFLKP